jgi:hypothetical protein
MELIQDVVRRGRFARHRRVAVRLDNEDIEVIAERAAHRVVQLLKQARPGACQLLDAKELALAT